MKASDALFPVSSSARSSMSESKISSQPKVHWSVSEYVCEIVCVCVCVCVCVVCV